MAVAVREHDAGLSDAALVERVRRGERDSFVVLLVRHGPVVRAVCRRLLGRSSLVEDVMQESAVEALVRIGSLRDPDRFGPWLCGIALNIGRRWLRDGSREQSVGEFADIDVADDLPAPEQLVLEREAAALIRAALHELPPGQRAAVWLFYLRDYSIVETAAALRTTPGAVKVRLHAARTAMRSRLPPPEGQEPTMTESTEQFVRVNVADVRAEGPGGESPPRHVVVLREADGDRVLPIWIGPAEARHLAFATVGETTQRPMTYALMRSLLDAAGVRISDVRVTSLADHVFIAAILVNGPTGEATVDARPSDAINIALETSAPIYVSNQVLDLFQRSDAVGGSHAVQELPRGATDIVATAKELERQAFARVIEAAKQHDTSREP